MSRKYTSYSSGSNTPAGYSRKENQRFVTSNSQYGSSISQNPSSATKRVLLAKRTPSAKQLASFCKSSPAPKSTKASTIGGHNPATTPVSSVKKTQSELDKHSFPHKTKASAAATTSHTTTSNKPAVTTFTSSSPTSSNVASNKVPGSSQTAVKKLGQVSRTSTQPPMASYLTPTDNSKKEEKVHKSGGGGGNVIPNPLVAATQGSKPAQSHNSTASTSVWDNKWSSGGVDMTTTAARQVSHGNVNTYARNQIDTEYRPVAKQSIKGLANHGNTCYCNALLQNLAVLITLYDMLRKTNSSTNRSYDIDGGTVAEPIMVTVNQPTGHLTTTLYKFLSRYHDSQPDPRPVLTGVRQKVNSRFGGGTQQDSHELFRCLLDGMRTEESDLIYKAVEKVVGTSTDGETKLKKRAYRRNIRTHVDDVFGGAICSTVVCRKCLHVSQVKEPFLDLSLPIVDSQRSSHNMYNQHNTKNTQRKKDEDKEEARTFQGVCKLLQQNKGNSISLPLESERSHDGRCNIPNCLSEYTDLEVMDSDNMFICTECNRRENMKQDAMGNNRTDDGPVLSLLSKLLLIDQLPQVLVLHLKRFSLGQFVRKNSKHVDFPAKLNMRRYCSSNCQQSTFDYRLKGVVSHSGSLHGGHYVAYVFSDDQWYYISDSHVSSVDRSRVFNCEAYMLFYESDKK